jgi:hypothetical protein
LKKFILPLVIHLTLFTTVAANAGGLNVIDSEQMGCDFVDSMYIKGPAGTHIIELSAAGLLVQKVNNTKFLIMGDCSGNSDGIVTVKIGTDTTHNATLTIDEGAYQWNPEVIKIDVLGGYFYTGYDHTPGGFSYTLNFMQQ